MKNTHFYFLLIVLLTMVYPSSLKAQETLGKLAKHDGLRKLEIAKALSQLPDTGAKPEDFMPAHWEILQRVDGDLNADGIKDFAVILALDEKDKKYMETLEKLDPDPSWIDEVFIIAEVDSRGDHKMHLGGINYQLLGDSGASVRNGDGRDEFKLAIRKNVLDVMVSTGGSLRSDASFHFREDPPTGGSLTLIGFESESYCVTISDQCGKSKTSENYLTNTRVDTDYKFRGNDIVGIDKKSQIPPVKIDFMDVRITNSNHKGGARPY